MRRVLELARNGLLVVATGAAVAALVVALQGCGAVAHQVQADAEKVILQCSREAVVSVLPGARLPFTTRRPWFTLVAPV